MDASKVLKRYDAEEKEALLQSLLEDLVPREPAKVTLHSAYEYIEEAQKLRVEGDSIIGVSSGYPAIDSFTRGFAPGDLIVVYGGTSHGKSQVMQNISWRIARSGQMVLFMGLEMTRQQNNTRFMDIADWMGDTYEPLLNVIYPDLQDNKLDSIEAAVKEAVDGGCTLVVIDQLQQLTGSITNRTNETSAVTAGLKRIAIKYQVPIVLLAHINRSGESTKAPALQELKDSSSIEQDADICIAVWRDMNPAHGDLDKVEVVCRKNRNRGHVGEGTILYVEGRVGLKQFDAITGMN